MVFEDADEIMLIDLAVSFEIAHGGNFSWGLLFCKLLIFGIHLLCKLILDAGVNFLSCEETILVLIEQRKDMGSKCFRIFCFVPTCISTSFISGISLISSSSSRSRLLVTATWSGFSKSHGTKSLVLKSNTVPDISQNF